MTERRRTFGPVVVVGLGSAVLAAVAGTKPWLDAQRPGGECPAIPGFDYANLELDAPLAGALALVLLAAWGVILVTRGRFRRVVAAVLALAAGGYLVTAIEAYWSLKDAALDRAIEAGANPPPGCPAASVWMNNDWWLVALASGAVAVAAAIAAFVLAPAWPEMGNRYDAPAHQTRGSGEPETNIDIWKAIDEGHDPTA